MPVGGIELEMIITLLAHQPQVSPLHPSITASPIRLVFPLSVLPSLSNVYSSLHSVSQSHSPGQDCSPKSLIEITYRHKNISSTQPCITTTAQPCSGGHPRSWFGLGWSILAIIRQNRCIQTSYTEELTLWVVEVQVLLARMGEVKKPGGG